MIGCIIVIITFTYSLLTSTHKPVLARAPSSYITFYMPFYSNVLFHAIWARAGRIFHVFDVIWRGCGVTAVIFSALLFWFIAIAWLWDYRLSNKYATMFPHLHQFLSDTIPFQPLSLTSQSSLWYCCDSFSRATFSFSTISSFPRMQYTIWIMQSVLPLKLLTIFNRSPLCPMILYLMEIRYLSHAMGVETV